MLLPTLTFVTLLPLVLAKAIAASCVGSDSNDTYISSLFYYGGAGTTVYLCQGATISLTNAVFFSAADQTLTTAGAPTGTTRATLVVTAADQSCAIYGIVQGGDNIAVRNIQVDGARPALGILVGGIGLIELGGADGISLACKASTVRGNVVTDATDGGIVIFGAPGSTISGNTIITNDRQLLCGIDMVDWSPFSGSFTGTNVIKNTIIASGNFMKLGIAIGGLAVGVDNRTISRTYGGNVQGNRFQSGRTGYFGYAIGMAGHENITIMANDARQANFGSIESTSCFTSLFTLPAPQSFIADQWTTPVASPDFVSSLASTLAALGAPGQERIEAEAFLDTLLHEHTSATLQGLAQLGLSHPDHVQRALAFILLRRLAFRPLSTADPKTAPREVWDLVDDATRTAVQDNLIQSLMQGAARKEKERGVICDVIAEVENAGVKRGGAKWPGLIAALTQLYGSPDLVLREALYRIYSECVVSLLESEPVADVITGLSTGLRDSSTGVRIAALKACVNLIKNADVNHIADWSPLVTPMLEVLPPLATERAEARLTEALLALIDLASTPKVPSRIFKPHLSAILSFSLSILAPSPFKTSPAYSPTALDETVRHPALEFLISIAETAPSMTKNFVEFSRKLVPTLLNLMSEQEEDPDWLFSEHFNDDDDESMSVIAEGTLDRLSQALGEVVFPPFLQALPSLLASPAWQARHAGLSGIAAIAEGCPDQVMDNLTSLKNLAVRSARDPHPRVRYAAVYAIGQLCTDMEGAVQSECGEEILRTLIEVSRGKESRLQAFAAAAMVNFFNSADVDLEPLKPVLAAVFEQLVSLLNNGNDFVKQNALEAMSLLAAFMETDFTPLYPQIMPQLLNLLESPAPTSTPLLQLRAKAIDCASQIAAAVDSSVAAPDAARLLQALHNIRLSLNTEEDTTTMGYLLGGFARLAETVGAEIFAPYVEDCFTQLMEAAQKKPDMTISAGGDEEEEEDDEWETVSVDGDVVAIRTSALEEKADACHQLVILVQAISSILPPNALKAVLQVAEPLLKFYFHVGVRESAAALIAVSVQGLSKSNISQEERLSILDPVSDAFVEHIAADTDAEVLATLIASWTTCYQSLPGCLSPPSRDRLIKALEAQLTSLAARDRARRETTDEDEDDALELAEFADGDVLVFSSINGAIALLLTAEGQGFPIAPFLPFLGLMSTGSPAPTHFALRLLCDIVRYTGEAGYGNVRPYLDRILNSLGDEDLLTRKIAAFAVGIAAETGLAVYLEFLKATIEPLFIAVGPLDLARNDLLAARDNCISALSKILRNFGDQVNGEALLPRWVSTLPVFVDSEEMAPVYSLLLELIARGHSSVSPATDAATHVTKVLVSALENSDLPPSLHRPMAQALKTYVSSIPAGGPTFSIPPHVEAKVIALLE
ncbi:hypothetical protein RQP46_009999 [Phenoliferia psychrophenolica]